MVGKTYKVIVTSGIRAYKLTRKQLDLATVNFGSRGWYVYSRRLEAFLQEDGTFSESETYYVKTRAAARELIKRYFQ